MEFRKLWLEENKTIFYFKNKQFDIDFLIFNNEKSKFIQVVYELNEQNYNREVEQLKKVKEKFNKEVYLVYYENNLNFDLEWINLIKFNEIKNILN